MKKTAVLVIMAFRNVAKNWRHSLAAILTISASFMAQVLFSGYMAQVENVFGESYIHRGMFGHLIVENERTHSTEAKSNPFKFYLSSEQQESIDQFLADHSSQVEVASRFLQIQGMATNGRTSGIFLANSYQTQNAAQIRGSLWKWNTLYGVPLQEAKAPQSILVAQTFGRIMGCQPDKIVTGFNSTEGYPPIERPFHCDVEQIQLSLLTETGQLNAMDFPIAGIIDSGYQDLDARYLQMSLQSAQTLLNTKKISYYSVLLKDPQNTEPFILQMNDFFKTHFPDLHAISWKAHPAGEMYRKTMDLLSIFKVFVVTVILIISCLSILNTMVKIVKERTREIGTLRSVGFVRSQIILLFSLEAFFLSSLGIILGFLFSLSASLALSQARIPYKAGIASEPVLFRVLIVPENYLISMLLLIGLAVLAAYLATRATVYRSVANNLAYA